MRIILVYLFCLMYVANLASESEQFIHFDKKNDFPFSTVDNVFEDSYGYLWIGSYTGLARYDGYTYELYTTQDYKNGLPSNRIFCIFETSNRQLMIGTNLGFAVYSRATNTFKLISYSCTPKMCEDKNGSIWVATFDGIDIFDTQTMKITQSFFCETDNKTTLFNSIICDKYNRIWALTAKNGIYVFDAKSKKHIKTLNSKSSVDIEKFEAYTMTFDKTGLLWLGSRGKGLICLDTTTLKVKTFINKQNDVSSIGSNNVSNLYVDNKNNLWVCCEYGYLNRFIRKNETFIKYMPDANNSRSIDANSISCINQDKTGNYWIGTFGKGLYCKSNMYNNFKTFIPSNTGISKSVAWPVMSFAELDNRTIAYACDGGGIRFYNPTTKTISEFINNNRLKSKNVTYLLKHNQTLWAATWGGGISKIDLQTNAVTNYINDENNTNSLTLNNIKALYAIDNELYIGTHGSGVCILDLTKNSFTHNKNSKAVYFDPRINNWVNHFIKDSKGYLWISTFYGLYRIDKSKITFYGTTPSHNSLNNFEVLSCIEDKNNQFWVLTSRGIELFDYNTQTFSHISDKYNLPSGARALTIDKEGNLWLSTTNKLFTISTSKNIVKEYDKNDGIVSGEFNINASLTAKNGTLYFGSADGFMIVNPPEIRPDMNKPTIIFRNLYVNYKKQIADSVYLTKQIELSDTISYTFSDSVISIEVAGVLLGRLDKINYSYKIDNDKDIWVQLGKGRAISLTALSPGKHILTVKASVENGIETTRNLTIIIHPKWYMTWWFRIFEILLIIVCITALVYLRIRNIKNKNIQLQQLVKERTQELESANFTLTQQSEKLTQQSHSLQIQNKTLEENQEEIATKNTQLVEVLETKDKIISILAHDFKNPLAGIYGLANILKEKISDLEIPHLQKYIDGIISSSAKLNDQMTTVIEWARGRAHDITCQKSEVNIEKIITDSINLVEGSCTQKNITIYTHYDYSSNAYIDPRMMSTVIRNLLINAIKFSHHGGKINITVQEYDAGLEISIIDYGVGMNQATIQSLFKQTEINSEKGTENEIGYGMGLHLCKTFVEKNDGTIKVTSNIGEGSIFTLNIPKGMLSAISKTDEANITIIQEEIIKSSNNIFDNNKYSILIVDDNKEMIQILESIFEKFFTVYTANDGKAGLNIARNMIPDIIISDINMPYITGIELCKAIKQDEMTSHIPIILITSISTNKTQIDSYISGADDYIEKPINGNIIVLKAKTLIQNRKKQIEGKQIAQIENKFILPESQEDILIKKILAFINESFTNSEFDVNIVAEKIGISRAQLWRKFKTTTGKNLSDYILDLRMNMAKEMLETGKYRNSEIAYEIGYTSPNYFAKCFASYFGCTPKEYLEQHKIRYNTDK